MIRILGAVACLLALSASLVSTQPFQLVWQDEFEGTTLDFGPSTNQVSGRLDLLAHRDAREDADRARPPAGVLDAADRPALRRLMVERNARDARGRAAGGGVYS